MFCPNREIYVYEDLDYSSAKTDKKEETITHKRKVEQECKVKRSNAPKRVKKEVTDGVVGGEGAEKILSEKEIERLNKVLLKGNTEIDNYKEVRKEAKDNEEVSERLIQKTDAIMALLECAIAEVGLLVMNKKTVEKVADTCKGFQEKVTNIIGAKKSLQGAIDATEL